MASKQVAIVARDIGVQYDLRLSRKRTIRRSIGEWFGHAANGHDGARDAGKKFWALRNVSFDVRAGDVLGVIGKNGSGKSTLLLTISGILRPDAGQVRTFGKTATLLTLGAGFEPNLTGRDNIYLNAAFLGVPKRRMDELIDGIIEFSELGDFIDVPLRKYSTGMRARLGFSIAAHIEPDVLLLDEVLGVGDESFRLKSKAKLAEMMDYATAIVVVTHSMGFVKETCTKALWLNEGHVAAYGPPGDVVDRYVAEAGKNTGPMRSVA